MNIGIDARFFGSRSKGLGRYTQKLIEHLEEIDHTNTYVVFLRKENFDEYTPRNKNFRKVCADYRWYSFAEQVFFPFVLMRARCDFIHFPHFNVPLLYRGRFVVTIHDLILIHFPTVRATTLHPLVYWVKFLIYKIVIRSAIARSQSVFAVSRFTRDDILSHYDVVPSKVVVTHEAGFDRDDTPRSSAQKTLRQHAIMKPYLLYVGNAYPHKNLQRLLLAFGELQKNVGDHDTHLVLVGKDDHFYQELTKCIERNAIERVHIIHGIDDESLRDLYAQALGYVFPSLYEGFGLPPLEAFAYGVPVASSDHPCMKEICHDAVLYFDGKDSQSIMWAMQSMITNTSLRVQLQQKGYERLKNFSWKKMAEQTYSIYKKMNVQK